MEHYLLLKTLHIFGVIIFLGNIIVTGFWKACADLSKDWKIIAFSQRLVTYTDMVFTAIGVLLIAVTGIWMAKNYANYLHITWIFWGLSFFIASGILWLLVLIPLQIKMHRLAKQFYNTRTIPDEYWVYEKIWMVVGIIATLLPLANLYWMVFKPS